MKTSTLLVIALAVLASCSKDSDEKAGKRDLVAERKALAERLTKSYRDAGVAAIEGDVLVITAEQCRKPKLASQVVDMARRAGSDLELADVRCQAPAREPAPTQQEVVERFNEQFKDIDATASIAEGDVLVLMTGECAKEGRARELLRAAAPLSHKAGFKRVRCGAGEDKMFELAADDFEKAARQ